MRKAIVELYRYADLSSEAQERARKNLFAFPSFLHFLNVELEKRAPDYLRDSLRRDIPSYFSLSIRRCGVVDVFVKVEIRMDAAAQIREVAEMSAYQNVKSVDDGGMTVIVGSLGETVERDAWDTDFAIWIASWAHRHVRAVRSCLLDDLGFLIDYMSICAFCAANNIEFLSDGSLFRCVEKGGANPK